MNKNKKNSKKLICSMNDRPYGQPAQELTKSQEEFFRQVLLYCRFKRKAVAYVKIKERAEDLIKSEESFFNKSDESIIEFSNDYKKIINCFLDLLFAFVKKYYDKKTFFRFCKDIGKCCDDSMAKNKNIRLAKEFFAIFQNVYGKQDNFLPGSYKKILTKLEGPEYIKKKKFKGSKNLGRPPRYPKTPVGKVDRKGNPASYQSQKKVGIGMYPLLRSCLVKHC